VGEVLAYDVAAGRAEDVADEKNVHLWILARERRFEIRDSRCEIRDAGRAWAGAEADPPPAAKDDNS